MGYITLRRTEDRRSLHPLLAEEALEDTEECTRATQFEFDYFSKRVAPMKRVRHDHESSQRTAYSPD